jgi:hypothetical protein
MGNGSTGQRINRSAGQRVNANYFSGRRSAGMPNAIAIARSDA